MSKTQGFFKSGSFVLLTASVAIGALGCRSKMDVKSKEGAKKAAIENAASAPNTLPQVEIPDGIKTMARKTYFQSRGVLSVFVDKEVVEGASSFSLLNTTNSAGIDSNAVEVLSEGVPKLGLSDTGEFSLTEVEGDKLKISFYPSSLEWKNKFVYGKNDLKVIATHATETRYALTEIYITDFNIFSFASSSFATGKQISIVEGANGHQFQGWFNYVAPASVGTQSNTLVSGMFDIINR